MRMRMLAGIVTLGVVAGFVGVAPVGAGERPRVPSVRDWSVAGQNTHNTRHAATERTIDARNVARLRPRWVFTANGDINATPAVVDGILYVPDAGGTLWAIRASDGTPVWSHPISDYTGPPVDGSRTTPAVSGDLVVIGKGFTIESPSGAAVIAVNRGDGSLRWLTQVDPNPRAKVTGAPVIDRGVVYVGISSSSEILPPPHTFRGSVVALDLRTGRILWRTYMAPPGYTGSAVWGSNPVVDRRRGLVYVGTGNNYTVPEGVCTRPEQTDCELPAADDYFDAVVALDLRTGRVRWVHKTLSADAVSELDPPPGTDMNFGSSPNLYTTTIGGRQRELLGIGQKSGDYWALDPDNGRVVWKTKVGPAGGMGGIQWGSSTDGRRIYVALANSDRIPFKIPSPDGGEITLTGGMWAALDAATGRILWRTPDPQGDIDMGYVTSANGVVYVGSGAGTGDNMYALDARTGAIRWRFASGGSVIAGAAVVDGSVYWGSGYHIGTGNNKLYAFDLR